MYYDEMTAFIGRRILELPSYTLNVRGGVRGGVCTTVVAPRRQIWGATGFELDGLFLALDEDARGIGLLNKLSPP